MKNKDLTYYKNQISKYAYCTVGPVIYEFTVWVLQELRRSGITKVYFLARDGYLPYLCALELCKAYFTEIQPIYLFTSRIALRTPTYHFIGDEAFRLLTLDGYRVTPRGLLNRALLNEKIENKILSELGIKNPDKPLNKKELDLLRGKLYKSSTYKNAYLNASRLAYKPAIQYFYGMGLFDNDVVAIVDSGWTGSMQRSLRQLLESCGFKGVIHGYYFGMYEDGRDKRYGEYHTFYFNKRCGLLRKVNFNNNLFECMLSANHPMTIGYKFENEKAIPVFAKEAKREMQELIFSQTDGALSYIKEKITFDEELKDKGQSVRKCYKILKRAMTQPTKEEAEIYGYFNFCDDTTEGYSIPLSAKEATHNLSEYSLVKRAFMRIFNKDSKARLIWPYGTLAYTARCKQAWYRFNIFLWDVIKYLRNSLL